MIKEFYVVSLAITVVPLLLPQLPSIISHPELCCRLHLPLYHLQLLFLFSQLLWSALVATPFLLYCRPLLSLSALVATPFLPYCQHHPLSIVFYRFSCKLSCVNKLENWISSCLPLNSPIIHVTRTTSISPHEIVDGFRLKQPTNLIPAGYRVSESASAIALVVASHVHELHKKISDKVA